MRARSTSAKGLTVQAIAGTYVTLLGFDLAPQDRTGLLGFAVQRTDQSGDRWLRRAACCSQTLIGKKG